MPNQDNADYPMPGPSEFSADEEKAMRQRARTNNASALALGALPIMQTARQLFNSDATKGEGPSDHLPAIA